MVDFRKRLKGSKATGAVVDPVLLYDTLDRAHDKGPLRPAQESVLNDWFSKRLDARDVIVKLHTGQGKTLVGLLMLLSRLNAKQGPALYLCPNNYLIEQTLRQAEQFGIPTCSATPELPAEFLDGRSILVTSVQKLFNGLTKFGLRRDAVSVGAILMDDAHACCDTIRSACTIKLERGDDAYHALVELFAADLERQGLGTFADIKNEKYDAILPVPYWAWMDKETSVAGILSKNRERRSIKFAWPLIKDMLSQCQCVVSGSAIEIEPYAPPLEAFGSYWSAPHRVFMSATVTDDAFLVKGLELEPKTIAEPLSYSEESWSGEKMVLIPSLIDERLDRQEIVHRLASPAPKRTFGTVALVTSFKQSEVWGRYGAVVADAETVDTTIQALQNGQYDRTAVLVNRYDGIDLPDQACRLLICDGRPYSESLVSLYQEACRPGSQPTLMRTLRTVEQGLGRSVRGEKDYSVIVMVGPDLTRLVREKKSRSLLSSQMSTQIEIGLEIADMARQDIENGEEPMHAFAGLILQCLNRNPDWKAFYAEQMEAVRPSGVSESVLSIYAAELSAEKKYRDGDYEGATEELQALVDAGAMDDADRGWYLQEMARFNYRARRTESDAKQLAAHRKNRLLLQPEHGVTVTKLTVVSQGRMERIIEWVRVFGDYEQLNVAVNDILSQLTFGTRADPFEQALDALAEALGLKGERPDKEWKEGPDNLWALDDTRYIVWECKSEVDVKRAEVNKREAEQMNRSCAWFQKHYPGCTATYIMVIPTHKLESAAAVTHDVAAMRVKELGHLVRQVRGFFKSFESLDFSDLSPTNVQALVNRHKLGSDELLSAYSRALRDMRRLR